MLPFAAEVRSEDVVNEKVGGSVRVVRSLQREQRWERAGSVTEKRCPLRSDPAALP